MCLVANAKKAIVVAGQNHHTTNQIEVHLIASKASKRVLCAQIQCSLGAMVVMTRVVAGLELMVMTEPHLLERLFDLLLIQPRGLRDFMHIC